MREKPSDFRELIERLGGVSAFADHMGITVFAAKKMRDRSSVNADRWPRLIEVAREHGGYLFTTDDFVAMRSLRRPSEKRKGVAA